MYVLPLLIDYACITDLLRPPNIVQGEVEGRLQDNIEQEQVTLSVKASCEAITVLDRGRKRTLDNLQCAFRWPIRLMYWVLASLTRSTIVLCIVEITTKGPTEKVARRAMLDAFSIRFVPEEARSKSSQ